MCKRFSIFKVGLCLQKSPYTMKYKSTCAGYKNYWIGLCVQVLDQHAPDIDIQSKSFCLVHSIYKVSKCYGDLNTRRRSVFLQ